MNTQRVEFPRRLEMLACLAVAAAVLVLLVTRDLRGIDFTDESFHAALAYRFLLGDVPFRDELAVHQTAALLTVPPLWVYDRIRGGPEGLVLFLRLAFAAFSAGLGILIWRSLLRFVRPLGATLAAAIFLVAHPAQDPSYNSLGSGFVTVSLLLGFFGGGAPSRGRLVASGLAAGLAVVAYPPMILWLAFSGMQLWLTWPAGERVRRALPFAVGASLVLLAFAGLVVAIGPRHLLDSIVRTNETANKLGGIRKILYLGRYFVLRIPILPILLVLAAWAVARVRPRLAGVRSLAFALALLGSSVGFFSHGHLRPLNEWTHALVSMSLLAPVLIAIGTKTGDARRALLSLWLGGLAAGGVSAYFTSNDPGNFAKFGRPCLVALVAAAWIVVAEESRSIRPLVRGLATALAALIVAFLGVTLEASRRHVYRDRPVAELTRRVEDGPFAGIRTSERHYELLSSLHQDLEANVPRNAYVIFFDDFPAGFLLSRRRPGICGAWVFTSADAGEARRIYVDCTREMNRTPLYGVRIAVNPREASLPERPLDERDPFQSFVRQCGTPVFRRQGLYDILRLDPRCGSSAPVPARAGGG
jgi:hypothetical protein